jgi:hypothetical protein
MIFGQWKIAASLAVAAALAACSGTEGPQAPPQLADGTCVQLRADLNSMDKRGVPGMIDARNNGKKLGAGQDAEVNRYNQVLDQYLGGQCASEARYKQKAGIPQAAPVGRQSSTYSAGMTTGSVPKTQVKRRKPINDEDDSSPAEKAASADDQAPAKPAKRKTTRAASQGGASATKASVTPTSAASAAPSATPAKAESGLPVAPAPVKAEGAEKAE